MPPPSRAKTEISEPPKPRPISASTAVFGAVVEDRGEHAVVAGDADQRQADDEQAGDAPPRKATRSAGGTPPRAASATRVLERTETFMPM